MSTDDYRREKHTRDFEFERAQRMNRMDWTYEATERNHRIESDEAHADWIADNYEPEAD